ncbi:MAG: hypothetical protein WCO16_04020 [bacterium]
MQNIKAIFLTIWAAATFYFIGTGHQLANTCRSESPTNDLCGLEYAQELLPWAWFSVTLSILYFIFYIPAEDTKTYYIKVVSLSAAFFASLFMGWMYHFALL